ncbi:MAG TPA: hypothetical protein VF173_11055 [Thermoanaerobaculia bacterium]|nr:hypothetical protein [Thermoanaerobaculia bacterium]
MPARKAPEKEASLTAAQVARQSGVPVRRIVEYTGRYGERIPHATDEEGRVRYFPRAVLEVQRLRREERAHKQATMEFTEADTYERALAEIETLKRGLNEMADRARHIETLLRAERPPLTAVLYTLPEGYRFRQPVTVLIQAEGRGFVASLPDVPLDATGRSRDEAAHALRDLIVATLERLEKKDALSDEERGQLDVLLTLVDAP